jgi:beta-galactosidase
MNSDFWINGHHLGIQPYGYTAFWYDLTKYLNYGDKENIITVEVKNEGMNSRWHSGSGIYRNVSLSIVNQVYIKPWGVYIITNNVDPSKSEIQIELNLLNHTYQNQDVNIHFEVIDNQSKVVASKYISTRIHHQVPSRTKANIRLNNPELWSLESPTLYKLICTVRSSKEILDKTEIPFGVRTIFYDSEREMFLNGKTEAQT